MHRIARQKSVNVRQSYGQQHSVAMTLMFSIKYWHGTCTAVSARQVPEACQSSSLLFSRAFMRNTHSMPVHKHAIIMSPPVGNGAVSFAFVRPSVCPSVAYIANSSRTRRPSVFKFGMKVPHIWCDSHTSFKVKRSRSPGPLMLTHIVRHIFRTARPTNFKLVTRMEDSYLTVPGPFDPGLPVPAPPVPQSAEYWPWMMAISYSISDSRPRCYGLIGSSSRIFCMNSCPSSLSN